MVPLMMSGNPHVLGVRLLSAALLAAAGKHGLAGQKTKWQMSDIPLGVLFRVSGFGDTRVPNIESDYILHLGISAKLAGSCDHFHHRCVLVRHLTSASALFTMACSRHNCNALLH